MRDTIGAIRQRLHHHRSHPDHDKWVALSNTTLGILMATINQSIVIIAMPAIFRGIDLNPLVPSNTSYLLWMLMGFMVVGAVLRSGTPSAEPERLAFEPAQV